MSKESDRIKLWQRSGPGKENFKEIDNFSEINLTHPTILFFPGIQTTHKRQASINGYLKNLENALGGPSIYDRYSPVQLLSLSYGAGWSIPHISSFVDMLFNVFKPIGDKPSKPNNWLTGIQSTLFTVLAYGHFLLGRDTVELQYDAFRSNWGKWLGSMVSNNIGTILGGENYTNNAVQALANNMLDTITYHANGSRLTATQVQKRFKNITFVSDSYGAITAQEFYVAIRNYLQKNGYTKDETEQILNATLLLNINGASISVNPTIKGFRSIDFTHRDDRAAKDFIPGFKDLVPQTTGRHIIQKLSKGKIRIVADSVENWIYCTSIENPEKRKSRVASVDPTRFSDLGRVDSMTIIEPLEDVKHSIRIYITPRDGHVTAKDKDGNSKGDQKSNGKSTLVAIFQRVLNNAVKGYGRSGDLGDLLSPTDYVAPNKENNSLSKLGLDTPKPLARKKITPGTLVEIDANSVSELTDLKAIVQGSTPPKLEKQSYVEKLLTARKRTLQSSKEL